MIVPIVGDLMDATADALVVTVDGSKKGATSSTSVSAEKRLGEAEWEYAMHYSDFPIPFGDFRHVEIDYQVSHLYLVSIIDHLGELKGLRYLVAKEALVKVLRHANSLGLTSVACPLLTCGWRLAEGQAQQLMQSASEACPDVNVHVHTLKQ